MTFTVHALTTQYLTWCEKHRAPRSYEWYRGYISNLLKYPGIADLDSMELKPFHLSEWLDSKTNWGPTYSRGAIVAMQRVYNWAEEMGYVPSNPIKKITKPPQLRRETYLTPEDYQLILTHLNAGDPFVDIFRFMWGSGCRPQEARHIEPRHVDIERGLIAFPKDESKGKRYSRKIWLQGDTLDIITRLMNDRKDDGKLFRNKRGTAWTKFALGNRMLHMSKKIGKSVCAYDIRHGFATRKLIQGHDHLVVGELLGHRDGSMLARVYAHLDKNDRHLKNALID